MKIKIWFKNKSQIVHAIIYKNSIKALKVITTTYYGPCYGIDKGINFYPRDCEWYELLK